MAITTSRREFLRNSTLAAAAFTLGAWIPFGRRALAAGGAPPQGVIDPNVFLRIGADSSVTVISKKFEMGQGVTTGLATLIAEELDADWASLRFDFAPAIPALYNNLVFGPVMATGGTTSILETWVQMRQVGAAARSMFVSAAAARWNVARAEVRVERGVLSHASGQRASFGELAADAMRQPVPDPQSLVLKTPAQWKLIGTRQPRLDSVMKTDGSAKFALDVKRPGMLTAMLRRPPQFGATVVSFDAAAARQVPGVVDVVQTPHGVAVLAGDTWSAMRGRDALKVEWDTSRAEKRSSAEIFAEYRALAQAPAALKALTRGDASGALARAQKKLQAEFTFPFLAHAPMEPLNAVLELRADGCELWSGSQLQSIDLFALSTTFGLKPEQVKINTLLGGGSFGRRGSPLGDYTFELAQVVKAINGRAPVHMVWTREDDLRGGYFRPAALHRVQAGIDAAGRITGWQHRVVCKSIFTGTPFQASAVSKEGVDSGSVEGLVDTDYAIDDFDVEVNNAVSPVSVLWWRSVGHSHTAHAMETMIDELARLAGKDALAFRAGLLAKDARSLAVLKLAAERAGWGARLPKGRGRGIAFHHSFGTRVAMVADVAMQGAGVKVERVVCAVDCGVAVNPDVVSAQIEGAIGFALSSVLRNRISLREGKVEQGNYDDYNPTRIGEMPAVQVHIVPSQEAPSGIGEPGVPPLAPAIGNAIFAASGRRLRSLPFDV